MALFRVDGVEQPRAPCQAIRALFRLVTRVRRWNNGRRQLGDLLLRLPWTSGLHILPRRYSDEGDT